MGPLSNHPGTVADPLPRLRERLANEYGATVSRETIDLVAMESLDELRGARVREFVPVSRGAEPASVCDAGPCRVESVGLIGLGSHSSSSSAGSRVRARWRP